MANQIISLINTTSSGIKILKNRTTENQKWNTDPLTLRQAPPQQD